MAYSKPKTVYSKPKTVAKSARKSSFVAGCPETHSNTFSCHDCEFAD